MNSVVPLRKSTILAAALASLTAAFLYAKAADTAPRLPIGDTAELPMTGPADGPLVDELCWTETDRNRGFGYYDFCGANVPHAHSSSQVFDERVRGGDDGGRSDAGGAK